MKIPSRQTREDKLKATTGSSNSITGYGCVLSHLILLLFSLHITVSIGIVNVPL